MRCPAIPRVLLSHKDGTLYQLLAINTNSVSAEQCEYHHPVRVSQHLGALAGTHYCSCVDRTLGKY